MASGKKADGTYERIWFQEMVTPDEVAFDAGVFLLTKSTAGALRAGKPTITRTLRVAGAVPPEVWNRLGTKILPKLRSGSELRIGLEFSVTVSADSATSLANELRQILRELGLAESVKVE